MRDLFESVLGQFQINIKSTMSPCFIQMALRKTQLGDAMAKYFTYNVHGINNIQCMVFTKPFNSHPQA